MKNGKGINSKFWNPTLRVVAIYALTAAIWILFSDQVLSWLTQDPAWLTRLQSYKGAGFVIVTSFFLFIVLRREVRKLQVEIDENIRIGGDLQASNEQLRALIDASPLVIIALDKQLNITTWNPAAERLFGWKKEEAIGKTPLIFPEELKEDSRTLLKRVIRGETIRDFETRRITKDGRILNVILSSAPLHNKRGEIDHIMAVLVDITDRKQAEEKLKQLSSELEQRVQERTVELEEANATLTAEIGERLRIENELRQQTQKLETINNELESFSFSVSHDLRAPLRQISGYSQLLLEEAGPEISAQAREDIERIRRGAELMKELIEALLALSRVSRGELHEMKMDLADIAREIFQRLSSQEPGRQVTLIAPEHAMIKADQRLMRIVMENLLSNAWKFTAQVRDARIEFGVNYTREKGAVYSVRDNGVGFPAEGALKIFNAFQRLHNPEEYPGLGIGLATVQRIVHRYGGDIWAEGETGSGATIFFTLGWAGRGE